MKGGSQNYFSYDHNFRSLVAQVVLSYLSESASTAPTQYAELSKQFRERGAGG